MMIDWLSLRLPLGCWAGNFIEELQAQLPVETRCSADGEIEWRKFPPQRLRSDTHALTCALTGSYLYLSGSPARIGEPNNVFGTFDIQGAALAMIRFFASKYTVHLPDIEYWDYTRIDITQNLYLGSPTRVLEALELLSRVQGGHFRVSSRSSTCYWNRGSDLLQGKAYHKGPHLAHQVAKAQATATPEEIEAAGDILRLELTFGSRWLRRWREYELFDSRFISKKTKQHMRPVWALTETQLEQMARSYWDRIIGSAEGERAMTDDELLQKLIRHCDTKGRARAAFDCWLAIKSVGIERTRESMGRSTWHKHKRALFACGITWADMTARKVVELRTRQIIAQPVNTWAELHQLRKAA